MREATTNKKLDELRPSVRCLVAGGFDSFDQILELAKEMATWDFPSERVDDLAQQVVRDEFERHFRDQATWPSTTDCDRLDAAFAELDRAGIVARQHFSCCGTCAAGEIRDVMDRLAAQGRVIRGYASYDVQSTEGAADGCGIALNYGAVAEGEAAALRIGHEVVDALGRHGLRTNWDGTWARRILVELDWKRRRDASGLDCTGSCE